MTPNERQAKQQEKLVNDVFGSVEELYFWLKQNNADADMLLTLKEIQEKLDEVFPVKNV